MVFAAAAVVIAVVLVNDGDDNAWCLVSALPFVVLC